MQYIIIFNDKNSKKAEACEYFSFSQSMSWQTQQVKLFE